MASRRFFSLRSPMPGSVDQLWAFHADPRALGWLVPPPMFVQVREDRRTSLTDGDIDFVLWLGPFPVPWKAAHEPGPTSTSFVDRMVSGPMAYWRHEHLFTSDGGQVYLTDRIELEHKPGLPGMISRLLFDGPALGLFFRFRHWRTRRGLQKAAGKPVPNGSEKYSG